MKKTSYATKKHIISFLAYGNSIDNAAIIFQCSTRTIRRILNEFINGLLEVDDIDVQKELLLRGIVRKRRYNRSEFITLYGCGTPSLFDELLLDESNESYVDDSIDVTSNDSKMEDNNTVVESIDNKLNVVILNKDVKYTKEDIKMFDSEQFISIYNKTKEIDIVCKKRIVDTVTTILKSTHRKADPIMILECLNKKPDRYLREIAKIINCSKSAIHKVLKKLKIKPKVKNIIHRKSNPLQRIEFLELLIQLKKEKYDIVYIDESSFRRHYVRKKKYAMKGDDRPSPGQWEKYQDSSVIGAMRQGQFIGVAVFYCSINADIFKTYITEVLLPTLTKKSAIVMDNAAIHKRPDIIKLIEDFGHKVVFLPPYSPQLNPIEKGWDWMKDFMASYAIDSVYKAFELVLKHKNFKVMYDKISSLGEQFNIDTYLETLKHLEHSVM